MSLTFQNGSAVDATALHERLIEILKDAVGRSTSARGLSYELGKSHNYVRRLFSGEIPLQVSTLLDMLQKLGMPPRIFFDQVFEGMAGFDPIAVLRFYREGDGLPRDPFLDEIGPRIIALSQRHVDPDAQVESRSYELDQLEERRFEDREGAKVGLEDLIREILADSECLNDAVPSRFAADVARACSIWAVIQRVSGYRDNACDMYSLAFRCLLTDSHPETQAGCYQKAAYLLSDLAAAEAGLWFLRVAADLYLRAGDLEGVGKVLVDNGILHWNLGRAALAIREFEAALKVLPHTSVRNRAAALSNLARCYEGEGQLNEAIDHIRAVCDLYFDRVDIVAAQILRTRARIASKLELASEAEDCFVKSINMYEQTGHPGDVLFAALDYAEWLFSSGQTRKLSELAEDVFSMAKFFRKNRLIDAALMEFVRTAKWGELTEELLKQTRRRLDAAAGSLQATS